MSPVDLAFGLTIRSSEDLPMGRVKFNVNTEYAYLQNFKILQSMCQRRLLMLAM